MKPIGPKAIKLSTYPLIGKSLAMLAADLHGAMMINRQHSNHNYNHNQITVN